MGGCFENSTKVLQMAKKAKAASAGAAKPGADGHNNGDRQEAQEVAAPGEAAAPANTQPQQLENAMVQQILERQAVFGF